MNYLLNSLELEYFELCRKNFGFVDLYKNLAIDLFKKYKNKINIQEYKILTVACYYFVFRMQFKPNAINLEMKNELKLKFKKIMNHLKKMNININEFFTIVKDFLNQELFDEIFAYEIKQILNRYSFIQKFNEKFSKIMNFMDLMKKDNFLINDFYKYNKELKSLIWLLFIDSKIVLLNNKSDIIESSFLLISCISYAIRLSSKYIIAKNIKDNLSPCQELLSIMNIQDYSSYKLILFSFENYFKNLVNNLFNQDDIFNPNKIIVHIKLLKTKYKNNFYEIGFNEFLMINENSKIQSNNSFTPFARQGNSNNNIKSHIKAAYNYKKFEKNYDSTLQMNCQRVLNYDSNNNENKNNLNIISTQIAFPKNIPASPYAVKGLPVATPMTAAIEMYNWIQNIVSKWKIKTKEDDNTWMKKNGNEFFENLTKKMLYGDKNFNMNELIENKKKMVLALYYKFWEKSEIEDNLSLEKFKNEDYHKGILIFCLETIFFILNISDCNFRDFIYYSSIDILKIWEPIYDFIKNENSIPTPLKLHLLDLEIKIISVIIWEKDSSIYNIIKDNFSKEEGKLNLKEFEKENENINIIKEKSNFPLKNRSNNSLLVFYKRLFSHVAYQIFQISSNLKLNEKIIDNTWLAIKYIFTTEFSLLIDHHIDQLILCSLYGVSKLCQSLIKFQDLINKYQELYPSDSQLHKEVIYEINISEDIKCDIIQFYNTTFINKMKCFLIDLINSKGKPSKKYSQTPQIKNHLLPKSILDSPIHQLLPSGVQNMKTQNLIKNGVMTPKTHLLYAFTESPLIKKDSSFGKSINHTINSKKLINFEESETSNLKSKINSKFENDQLEEITESNNENIIEKYEISNHKQKIHKKNLNLIGKFELTKENESSIEFKLRETPKNSLKPNFISSLSQLSESTKLSKNNSSRNKFVKLNFE